MRENRFRCKRTSLAYIGYIATRRKISLLLVFVSFSFFFFISGVIFILADLKPEMYNKESGLEKNTIIISFV